MVGRTQEHLEILILNDIEGVSGIDDVRQIYYGSREFEGERVQATDDITAAVR